MMELFRPNARDDHGVGEPLRAGRHGPADPAAAARIPARRGARDARQEAGRTHAGVGTRHTRARRTSTRWTRTCRRARGRTSWQRCRQAALPEGARGHRRAEDQGPTRSASSSARAAWSRSTTPSTTSSGSGARVGRKRVARPGGHRDRRGRRRNLDSRSVETAARPHGSARKPLHEDTRGHRQGDLPPGDRAGRPRRRLQLGSAAGAGGLPAAVEPGPVTAAGEGIGDLIDDAKLVLELAATGVGLADLTIVGSVGRSGKNQPHDVAAVCARMLGIGYPPGSSLTELGAAIARYQGEVVGMSTPDGRIDPGGRTLAALRSGKQAPALAAPAPAPAAGPAPASAGPRRGSGRRRPGLASSASGSGSGAGRRAGRASRRARDALRHGTRAARHRLSLPRRRRGGCGARGARGILWSSREEREERGGRPGARRAGAGFKSLRDKVAVAGPGACSRISTAR